MYYITPEFLYNIQAITRAYAYSCYLVSNVLVQYFLVWHYGNKKNENYLKFSTE